MQCGEKKNNSTSNPPPHDWLIAKTDWYSSECERAFTTHSDTFFCCSLLDFILLVLSSRKHFIWARDWNKTCYSKHKLHVYICISIICSFDGFCCYFYFVYIVDCLFDCLFRVSFFCKKYIKRTTIFTLQLCLRLEKKKKVSSINSDRYKHDTFHLSSISDCINRLHLNKFIWRTP